MANLTEFVPLPLGEQTYTFRALDLDQLEELEPQFAKAAMAAEPSATIPKESLQAIAEIAAASLKFKHPDITVPQVRKLLTLGTINAVMEAVRGVSGLVPMGEGRAGNP